MKRLILGTVALMLIIGFTGCDDDKNKNLDKLLSLIKGHKMDNVKCEYSRGGGTAIDGVSCQNYDGSISFILGEWRDSESLKKERFPMAYNNGRFAMTIFSPRPKTELYKKILTTFEDY